MSDDEQSNDSGEEFIENEVSPAVYDTTGSLDESDMGEGFNDVIFSCFHCIPFPYIWNLNHTLTNKTCTQ